VRGEKLQVEVGTGVSPDHCPTSMVILRDNAGRIKRSELEVVSTGCLERLNKNKSKKG
jgi:hypothetical protein